MKPISKFSDKVIAFLKRIAVIIRTYPEFAIIPFVALAVIYIPSIITMIDPTAGEYDLSVFQAAFIALLIMMFANVMMTAYIKYNFPSLHKWYLENFNKEWWENPHKYYLLLLCFLLLIYALIFMAVI